MAPLRRGNDLKWRRPVQVGIFRRRHGEEIVSADVHHQERIARDKAAQATSKANEILSKTTASGAMNVIEKMETKVQEREARAAALAELGTDQLDKQFKNFEGKTDIEMELLALKGSMGKSTDSPKLTVKEPVLIEVNKDTDSVDAEEVQEKS